MFGNLVIRLEVIIENPKVAKRNPARLVVIRTIHCDNDEARRELGAFVALNPHLRDSLRAEFVAREHLHIE